MVKTVVLRFCAVVIYLCELQRYIHQKNIINGRIGKEVGKIGKKENM